MARTRAGALYAEVQVSPTHTTARSARFRKKTEMGVQRLLTWEAPRQICSMNERNTGLNGVRAFNTTVLGNKMMGQGSKALKQWISYYFTVLLTSNTIGTL